MRKAQPFLAVLALECFIQNNPKTHSVTINQLERFLTQKANFSKRTASEEIHNLLNDKIIVKVLDDKKKPHGHTRVQLFSKEDLEIFDQDWYCFECFKPGELTKCLRCTRAFHLSCVRKYPERPNYIVPATNLIDEFEDPSDNEASSTCVDQQNETPLIESNEGDSPDASSSVPSSMPKIRPCQVVLVDIMRSSSTEVKTEIDYKSVLESKMEIPDIICMGEVRPPTRQRASVSVTPNFPKNESENIDDPPLQLCTCCRMLVEGPIKQPPNLLADEMHHLLNFGFKRSRAWIARDIYMELKKLKIPEKYVALLIKKLFQSGQIMTLGKIHDKIKNKKYKLLVEILVDLLDFQFTIGVLFGSASLFFDCSKYSVRDLSYEMAEIRRCPDCYRYSNDRFTEVWFTFPCVQRHELVYAKCSGHPYWPAKVVRVLRNASKYDVRFFGRTHARSVIDASNIRAIDSLNISFPNNLSFKEAMHELRCYQALSQYSPTRFGFYSNKEEILEIVECMMGAITIDHAKPSKSAKKRKTLTKNNRTLPCLTSASENEADSEAGSSTRQVQSTVPRSRGAKQRRSSPPKLMRLEDFSNANSPASVASTPTPTQGSTINCSVSTITMEQHISEMNAMRELHQREMSALREFHQRELTIAKLKPYCVKCLQPAKFLCCIHAWYCSKICQRQHWYEGHDKQCDNSTTSSNGCLPNS